MSDYLIPAHIVRTELTVVNSRFIATAGPTLTVTEAKSFIRRIRSDFPDASHNVPAYLIGHAPSVTAHCSDDGEPSGTAGRPALAVLRGSGLGDITVVVTRYFGGTKLGTGGLVRAYGDAVREVLTVLPRARRTPTHFTMMALPYPLYEQASRLIVVHHGTVTDEDFGGDVTITASFPIEHFTGFQTALRELSRGQVQAEIIETGEAIVPVNSSETS